MTNTIKLCFFIKKNYAPVHIQIPIEWTHNTQSKTSPFFQIYTVNDNTPALMFLVTRKTFISLFWCVLLRAVLNSVGYSFLSHRILIYTTDYYFFFKWHNFLRVTSVLTFYISAVTLWLYYLSSCMLKTVNAVC